MAPATTQVRLGGTLLTSVPDDDDDEGGAGGGGAPATMGSVSEASGAPPAGCWLEWPRGPDAERCDALLKDVEPATVADVCRMASPSGQETRARPGSGIADAYVTGVTGLETGDADADEKCARRARRATRASSPRRARGLPDARARALPPPLFSPPTTTLSLPPSRRARAPS